MTETILARRSGEIHVNPGCAFRYEALQKACRQDLVGFAANAALADVGDLRLEVVVEVIVHGERPDTFP